MSTTSHHIHDSPSDRVEILGCPIDRVGIDEAVERCRELIEEPGRTASQVSVNAAKLVAIRDDEELSELVLDCDLVTADGQSVVWASRLLGDALPERVAGIDLMQRLLELAEEHAYRVFFLGATPRVLARALAAIRLRHPRVQVAGSHDGYFRADEDDAVRDEIQAAAPDILFVAMSSPRKEHWVAATADLDVGFAMGVGGSLDVIAGEVRRAPRILQRLGLEWLFRLAQEPRRLMRRYVTTNTRFLLLLTRELRHRQIEVPR
jgi:N-acetylglucosaminyldiphosphoundecaprenol N-acetyl-beta-D-mannosaminyltransferase